VSCTYFNSFALTVTELCIIVIDTLKIINPDGNRGTYTYPYYVMY